MLVALISPVLELVLEPSGLPDARIPEGEVGCNRVGSLNGAAGPVSHHVFQEHPIDSEIPSVVPG